MVFGWWSSGKKQEEKPVDTAKLTKDAIDKCKQEAEGIKRTISFVQKKVQMHDQRARLQIKAGNKEEALQELRKKKGYAEELAKCEGLRAFLERQAVTLEVSQTQRTAVGAISACVDAIKAANGQMSATDISKLLEESEEQQKELDNVSNKIALLGLQPDEKELEDELNQMEIQVLSPIISKAPRVPSVPVGGALASQSSGTRIRPQSTTDEDQLNKLLNDD